MKTPAIAVLWLLSTAALAASGPAQAVVVDASPAVDFAALEAAQSEADAKSDPRAVPARSIPVPGTVRPELQALAAAPYRVPAWNANPKSADEWKDLVAKLAARGAALQPGIREKLGVTMQPAVIGGVNAFILTPRTIPPENRNRLLIHVHGGGYVYGPGEAGTQEATLMVAFGGFKVISFDYRMPPDFPYPAAMDDAMAVWKAAPKMRTPRNMAIFGTSTGGSMTLAMILRAAGI
jgi:monoterpene epsilon-lactone hydrolase